MKYGIFYDTPLEIWSIITFNLDQVTYNGRVAISSNGYYISIEAAFKDGKIFNRFHYRAVKEIFRRLGTTPKDYYAKVLGRIVDEGVWPETSLEDLEKVLAAMKEDFEALNLKKGKIDSSKFRFRIGDDILFRENSCKIVGYYFSEGFNNFGECYGYVIEGVKGGCTRNLFGYDEFGNHLDPSPRSDYFYVREDTVNKFKNYKNKEQDGNEIKLQRSKATIVRREVPKGCRICSKINKTAISVESISYSTITRGSSE